MWPPNRRGTHHGERPDDDSSAELSSSATKRHRALDMILDTVQCGLFDETLLLR